MIAHRHSFDAQINATHGKSTAMDLTLDNISDYARRFTRHPHPILADLEADAAARRVLDDAMDANASATKHFTETLLQPPHLDASLIAIRDGLLVCRKREA